MADCEIVPIERHTAAEAARTLSAAFAEKQPFSWLAPEPATRARILTAFFEGTLRYTHPKICGTQIAVVGNQTVGCAIWNPPGRSGPGALRRLAAGLHLMRRAGPANLKGFGVRGQILEQALETAHPSAPHWYLVGLAVHPHWHGRGIGTQLLRSGLARSDATAAATYLECLDSLTDYYARFGFRAQQRIFLAPETPEQVGMWRDAGAG